MVQKVKKQVEENKGDFKDSFPYDEDFKDFSTVEVPDDWGTQSVQGEYQLLSEYANRRYIMSLTIEDKAIRASLFDHDLNEVDFCIKFQTIKENKIDVLELWNNVREAINQVIERNHLTTKTSERVIGLGIVNCSSAVMVFNRITA
jgi:hypothetical protein